MVGPAEEFAEAGTEEELVRRYARALADGAGNAPFAAAELRRAFLDRRRGIRAAARTTPPPPPRAARVPRAKGRLAKQPRLDQRRPLGRLTYGTIVVIALVVGARSIRSCGRLKEKLAPDRDETIERVEPDEYGIGDAPFERPDPEEEKKEGEPR